MIANYFGSGFSIFLFVAVAEEKASRVIFIVE